MKLISRRIGEYNKKKASNLSDCWPFRREEHGIAPSIVGGSSHAWETQQKRVGMSVIPVPVIAGRIAFFTGSDTDPVALGLDGIRGFVYAQTNLYRLVDPVCAPLKDKSEMVPDRILNFTISNVFASLLIIVCGVHTRACLILYESVYHL